MGVIPIPEIIKEKVTPNDKLVILASNGVWEHLSSQDAVNVAKQHWQVGSSHKACMEFRGLDDDLNSVGVILTPEIVKEKVTPADKLVILASAASGSTSPVRMPSTWPSSTGRWVVVTKCGVQGF